MSTKFYPGQIDYIVKLNDLDDQLLALSTNYANSLLDSSFYLMNVTDNTKRIAFSLSGISTGTTRTYTLPNTSSTLAVTGNFAQTFSGTTTFSSTVTFSGTSVTVGSSTATSTLSLGSGATISGSTKTVNIGTSGVAGSTTNITLGSTTGTSTTTVLGTFKIGSVTYANGSGSPEGVLTASVGSIYTRTDGSAGSTLYVKESGTGNTGWVAK